MQITSPYGEKATWLCQEAFWNDAFPPPNATQVLGFGLRQNLGRQIASLLGMFQDPGNEDLPTDTERKKEQAKTKPGERPTVAVDPGKKAGVRVKASLISTLAFIPLVVLTYVLLGLIWLLHFVPSIGPLDKIITWVRKLDPFITSSLGDIQRYVDHEVWSANARARVEKVVIDMLKKDGMKDITIVAHSMGTVVAYDALTEGGSIAQEIAKSGAKDRKKITFVSVGGAINRVFAMIPPPGTGKKRKYNEAQITKPLAKEITGAASGESPAKLQDQFYWLDIYARRDPVPAGPVDKEIVDRAKIDAEIQMKEREVINKDSPFFDHVAYWGNQELVMPRIVRAINRGTEYPWPGSEITKEMVSRRVRTAAMYSSIGEVILALIPIGLIVFLILKLTKVI